MSCPRDAFGQPACQIVQHPDRPTESFCATCQRRFNAEPNKEAFPWLPMILGAFAVVLLLVVATEPPQPDPQPTPASINSQG